MKVRIDPDMCNGHGRCYSLTPELFDSDDRGHGVVILEESPEELRGKAELAIQNCPEKAISVVED